MPTIKELRLKIKSLKNTGKITAAMKLVSASRLKRAQDAITRTRPYSQKMRELLTKVINNSENLDNPLMLEREVKRVRYYVFTSDRGLCGGFNNGVIKYFVKSHRKDVEVEVTGIGKRSAEFVLRKGFKVPQHLKLSVNKPTYENAAAIAHAAMDDFLSGKVDEVYLVFNQFFNVMSQKPMQMRLLPCSPEISAEGEKKNEGYKLDYIFEPNAEELFNELLPKQVEVQVFRCLLENAAGEHGARMSAMDSATRNAKDLISRNTLQMNKARQAAITKELIEIVSGAEAL